MRTLFLAWQATQGLSSGVPPSRGWFPVGKLEASPEEHLYRFMYTKGAESAQKAAGFGFLDAFPKLDKVYESSELFPLFQNRVLNPRRGDYAEYVERLALDPKHVDPLDILAISEGRRQTDNLEVFPQIQPRRDGSFVCRFFLHGWKHVSQAAQDRLLTLKEGDSLQVAIELNNPASGTAVQLETSNDYHMIGWTPRYLVEDLLQALKNPQDISARVVKVNPEPAPYNQRVLIEFEGKCQSDYRPMSSLDFQPLLDDVIRNKLS
jgi:hypothetical protein